MPVNPGSGRRTSLRSVLTRPLRSDSVSSMVVCACRTTLATSSVATRATRPAAVSPKPEANPVAAKAGLPDSPLAYQAMMTRYCVGCHNAKDRKGEFDMTSFKKLMAGSEAGKGIIPGKPDESHLVLRIKGKNFTSYQTSSGGFPVDAELPHATTEFVCLECVGSPHLCVVEGEGMLRMRLYPEGARAALAAALA